MLFRKIITIIIVCISVATGYAQDAHIMGHITDENGKLMHYVSVTLKGTQIGGMSDETGHYFLKDLPMGEHTVIFSCIGYVTEERKISLTHNQMLELNVQMKEESFIMDNIVVTANKYSTKRRETANIVNVIPPIFFEATNAQSMADVLNFQTGLRVEQTCSNCGVPQLRINGLEGQYTQILMDSRPIFSSLASVYGLEQVPAGMVDRVEVIRGGGSALYGANAIGGVVNIITKEPTRNFVNVNHTTSLLQGGSTDINTAFNASVVSDGSKMGLFVFAVQRNRRPYDRDDDGFSDMPLLNSTTAGFRSFFKTNDYSRLTAEYHHVGEYRRGGCDTDLPPHETDLAEQLRHSIDAGSMHWDYYSSNNKHFASVYASLQNTSRESYFGTAKNPDAYGRTSDITVVGGGQYKYSYPFTGSYTGDLSAGLEYSHNRLHDRMLGYERDLIQRVNIFGGYVQNEWKNDKLSLLLGARLEKHNLLKNAVFSPRANLRYTPQKNVIFRLSYASGYRAPQAYDEDLHVGAVGGEVSLIMLDENLKPEYSHSISGSIDLYRNFGNWETNLTLEGFYTRLNDVFALVDIGTDTHGNLLKLRQNADGAYVAGLNIEGKIAYRKMLSVQGGFTIQSSRYTNDFQWNDNIAPQRRMFRTPNQYGYFLINYNPTHHLSLSLNGKATGNMLVQHNAGYIENDEEIITPAFFEMGIKAAYEFHIYDRYTLEVNCSINNLFNQYQKDLDRGMDRDASFIYGPAMPRTYTLGVNIKL